MEDKWFLENGGLMGADREFEKEESEFDFYEPFKDEPADPGIQLDRGKIEEAIRKAKGE